MNKKIRQIKRQREAVARLKDKSMEVFWAQMMLFNTKQRLHLCWLILTFPRLKKALTKPDAEPQNSPEN